MVQKMVHAVEVAEDKQLVHIHKEWHSRKRDGKDICWLVIDREKEYMILAQKLAVIADYINATLTEPSKANIVSMQGMYLCVDGSDKSNGGWHRGRWRVKHADLANGDAVELFESMRRMYEKPILLGASGVYVTQYS